MPGPPTFSIGSVKPVMKILSSGTPYCRSRRIARPHGAK